MHRRLTSLPEGDVIVHSGDFTMAGTEAEALDFMEWFCDLPYRHKVFIAGNHDFCLRGASLEGLDENCVSSNFASAEIGSFSFSRNRHN